jgi:hypothetical protein
MHAITLKSITQESMLAEFLAVFTASFTSKLIGDCGLANAMLSSHTQGHPNNFPYFIILVP